MTKRKLVRNLWKKNRYKEEDGTYSPTWAVFKKDYLVENPKSKKDDGSAQNV